MSVQFPITVTKVTQEVRNSADAIEFAGYSKTLKGESMEAALDSAGLLPIYVSASNETLARCSHTGALHLVKFSPKKTIVSIRVAQRITPDLVKEVREWAVNKNDTPLAEVCDVRGAKTTQQWQDIAIAIEEMLGL